MGSSGASHVVAAGILSSSFHALTGPDHLAALLPFILCKRWYQSGPLGLTWGLGHGLSSSLMGSVAVALKGRLLTDALIEHMSSWASFLVGATLLVIGAMGLFELGGEAMGEESYEMVERPCAEMEELKALVSEAESKHKSQSGSSKRPIAIFLATLVAQFSTGFLLGLALDAVPSVSPALWLTSRTAWVQFFLSYTLGTMCTMAFLAALVGESTTWLGSFVVALPTRLALVSSYGSIVTGLVWLLSQVHLERELMMVLLAVSPLIMIATVWAAVMRGRLGPAGGNWGPYGGGNKDDYSLPLWYVFLRRWFPSLAAAFLGPRKKLKVGDTPLQV